ncbi:hypothetical protein Hanom_Chr14g01263051 [Helianthus anomalus]
MCAPLSSILNISSLYSSILSCTYIFPPFLFFCSLLSARSNLKSSHQLLSWVVLYLKRVKKKL